jgi:hypothetical protein
MQMVWPAPWPVGTSAPARAARMTWRKPAPRSTLKLTNGPAALADASSSVGWNAAAISWATSAGALPSRLAAGKQPTA